MAYAAIIASVAGSALSSSGDSGGGDSGGGGIGGFLGGIKGDAESKVAAPIQAGIGIIQKIKGNARRKNAIAAQPTLEDPEERMRLTHLEGRAKSFEDGTAFSRERQVIGSLLRSQNINAVRLSGGSGGAAIGASARNFKAAGSTLVKLGAESRRQGTQAEQLVGQLLTRISQRKLDLRNLKSARLFAESAQLTKAGNANLGAAVASAVGSQGQNAPVAPEGATTPIAPANQGTAQQRTIPDQAAVPVTQDPDLGQGTAVAADTTNLTNFF